MRANVSEAIWATERGIIGEADGEEEKNPEGALLLPV
jgi:hypothetical protein